MSETSEQKALIAFGANLPNGAMSPEQTIRSALAALASEGFEIVQVSRFFASPCFPAGAGPDYVNGAAMIGCGTENCDATSLLAALHRIESRYGRQRLSRWGMRTLDLDLLAVGQRVLPDAETQTRWRDLLPEAQAHEAPERLILPHPRMQDRAFVLVPLAEIAPDWCHPVLRQTVTQMLAMLPHPDVAQVVAL